MRQGTPRGCAAPSPGACTGPAGPATGAGPARRARGRAAGRMAHARGVSARGAGGAVPLLSMSLGRRAQSPARCRRAGLRAPERACVWRMARKAGCAAAAPSLQAPALPGAHAVRAPRVHLVDPQRTALAARPAHGHTGTHRAPCMLVLQSPGPYPTALPWQARPPRARARPPRWAAAPAATAARSARGRPGTRAAGPGPGRTARCRRPACLSC
jgi:hypothetical protein